MPDISRYPQQVAVIRRKQITLGVDANLELAGISSNSRGEKVVLPPLSMHGPYSCFRWTLIDKSGTQPIYPSANIPCSEVPVLRTKVNAVIAQNTLRRPKMQQQNLNQQSLAYTVKIRMSKFKGKTPAEILLANENDLNALLELQDYLRKQGPNSRYQESNQQQIQAIEEAIELYRAKELSPEMVENDTTGSVVVYHRPQKVLLNRPTKGDHYFVYSFKIECIPEYNYPWIISIGNAYMKIKKKSDGTHETIPNTSINRTVSQLQISDYEMGYIVERIHNTLMNFELIFFKKQYVESMRQYQALRESFHTGENSEGFTNNAA